MATTDRPSSTVMLARSCQLPDRLWRTLAAQRPAVKWGLGLAALLAVAAVSYWGGAAFDFGRALPCLEQTVLVRRLDQDMRRTREAANRLPDRRTAARGGFIREQFDQAGEASRSSNWASGRLTKSARPTAQQASGTGPANASRKRS